MPNLNQIVVLNLALALAHQADAAYWHEWEMFGLPGGIQFFNILNTLLCLALLACFVPIIKRKPSGFACSLLVTAACASILPIHGGFALAGYPQFHLPVSVFLVVATFVVSIVQIVLTIRARGEFRVA